MSVLISAGADGRILFWDADALCGASSARSERPAPVFDGSAQNGSGEDLGVTPTQPCVASIDSDAIPFYGFRTGIFPVDRVVIATSSEPADAIAAVAAAHLVVLSAQTAGLVALAYRLPSWVAHKLSVQSPPQRHVASTCKMDGGQSPSERAPAALVENSSELIVNGSETLLTETMCTHKRRKTTVDDGPWSAKGVRTASKAESEDIKASHRREPKLTRAASLPTRDFAHATARVPPPADPTWTPSPTTLTPARYPNEDAPDAVEDSLGADIAAAMAYEEELRTRTAVTALSTVDATSSNKAPWPEASSYVWFRYRQRPFWPCQVSFVAIPGAVDSTGKKNRLNVALPERCSAWLALSLQYSLGRVSVVDRWSFARAIQLP